MWENQSNTTMPLKNYASAMLVVFTGNLGTMTNIASGLEPAYSFPKWYLVRRRNF